MGTTKKKPFYIDQLTSIIAKTDVNESAVVFL